MKRQFNPKGFVQFMQLVCGGMLCLTSVGALHAEVIEGWAPVGNPRIENCNPNSSTVFDGGQEAVLQMTSDGAIVTLVGGTEPNCDIGDPGHNVTLMWYPSAAAPEPCSGGQQWAYDAEAVGVCRGKPVGEPDCDKAISDPIDMSSGNTYLKETDLSLFHSSGALTIQRHYSSNASSKVSNMGRGWSYLESEINGHIVDGRYTQPGVVNIPPLPPEYSDPPIFKHPVGGYAATLVYKTVYAPDGKPYVFSNYEPSEYSIGWTQVGNLISSNTSIILWRGALEETEQNTFIFEGEDHIQYTFSSAGRLLEKRSSENDYRITYNRDLAGRIVGVTDEHGNQFTILYDSNNYINTITAPDIGTITYEYDVVAQTLIKASFLGVDGAERIRHYTYYDENKDYKLESVADEIDGQIVPFAHWDYDAEGRGIYNYLGSIQAERSDIEYLSDTQVRVTNPLGKQTKYTLSGNANAKRIVKIEGIGTGSCAPSNTDKLYSGSSNYTETDSNGSVKEIYKNQKGQVTEERRGMVWSSAVGSELVIADDSKQIETSWHPDRPVYTQKVYSGSDGSGNWSPYRQVDVDYNDYGNVTSYTVTDLTNNAVPYSTANRVRSWTYNYTYQSSDHTLLSSMTVNGPLDPAETADGIDDITAYYYNASGTVSSIVNPLGQTTTYSNYNALGLAETVVDVNGVTTNLDYDTLGNLRSIAVVTGAGTATTQFTYYENGLLQSVTLPNGEALVYEYNSARHLTAIENNLGERIEYVPSLLDGQWVSATIKRSDGTVARQQSRVFDELGRVMNLLGNNGQQTDLAYGPENNLTGTTEKGYGAQSTDLLTQHEYDGLNRLARNIDPLLGETQFGYDKQGNLASVTDPNGNMTSYVYDGFGQLIMRDSPDTGLTLYYYDLAGNLTGQQNDRGVVTSTLYDALSRPVQQYTNWGQSVIDWTYDQNDPGHTNGVGRLTKVSDSSGTTDYSYNDLGLLVGETKQLQANGNSVTLATGYQYDLAGRLTAVIYPGGRTVSYQQTAGQLTSLSKQDDAASPVEVVVNSVGHEAFGQVTSFQFGNGLTQSQVFDLDGRVSAINVSNGANVVKDTTFGYDPFNNITAINQLNASTTSQSFTYDELHRLNQAIGIYGTIDYQYDAVGNRLQRDINRTGYSRTEYYSFPFGNNQLDSISVLENGVPSSRTFVYDAVGNRVHDNNTGGTTLQSQYDEFGRMKSVN